MSAVALQMLCVAGWLGLAVLAVLLSRSKSATAVVYGATLFVSMIALAGSVRWLLGGAADSVGLALPIGLPNSSRQEAATADTGFQSATTRSQCGRPWVGTKQLDTKAAGNRTRRPTAWADSR